VWTDIEGDEVLVSRRGFRESDRFDIILSPGAAEAHRTILKRVPVIDPFLAEILRIWKGIPGYPGEISEEFNPYESGFTEFLNERKGCYVGQEIVARLSTYDKVQRGLTGIRFSADPGSKDLHSEGVLIGKVTSFSQLAVDGWYPGLAIVRKSAMQPGAEVTTSDSVRGVLTPVPFPVDQTDPLFRTPSGHSPDRN
jgi:folate-binding protein YgfZ